MRFQAAYTPTVNKVKGELVLLLLFSEDLNLLRKLPLYLCGVASESFVIYSTLSITELQYTLCSSSYFPYPFSGHELLSHEAYSAALRRGCTPYTEKPLLEGLFCVESVTVRH